MDIEMDWSKLTDRQAAKLFGLFTGKLTHCHSCNETVPVQSVVVIGVLDDGMERHICQQCASEERNYARNPEEECIQCGVIRAKEGSQFCSAICEQKMRALGMHPDQQPKQSDESKRSTWNGGEQ